VAGQAPLPRDQLGAGALVELDVVVAGAHPGAVGPAGDAGDARLVDSTPLATTRSYCPAITPCAACSNACWLDPHARLTVTPGTVSGQPAASAA
jgi:hypothetical protein